MIIGIVIFIAFIALGIFVANNAPSEFLKIYREYKKFSTEGDLTVMDFLNKLANSDKFFSVKYVVIDKELDDSYYYKTNTVYLSKSTANGYSIANFAVIAHELGHAEQNLDGSKLYKFSIFLRRLSKALGWLAFPFMIIGLVFLLIIGFADNPTGWIVLILGAVLFLIMLISSLVITIIEFNASNRAINLLQKYNVLEKEELKKAKRFLRYAGYTYLGNFFSFLFSWTFLVPKAKVI